jgi:hypothetical protein
MKALRPKISNRSKDLFYPHKTAMNNKDKIQYIYKATFDMLHDLLISIRIS